MGELWNGDTANPWMNSGNHVMLLGDLVSWIYEDVAGINSDENKPGFKHIVMKPAFNVDEIDDINASYKSIYGTIVSRWHKKAGKLIWHVEIPANTTAELHTARRQHQEHRFGQIRHYCRTAHDRQSRSF